MEAWLLIGIEEIPREHRTDYEVFAKQQPTFAVMFRNPFICGECDTPPLSSLTPLNEIAFEKFCRVRYGLDKVRVCYAIYAEEQRIVDDRTQNPRKQN